MMPILRALLILGWWCVSPPIASALFHAELSTGVQTDNLKWSIGSGNFVLSELDFHATSIKTQADLLWVSSNYRWSFDIRAGLGKIVSGNIQDDDYGAANRQDLFSRSRSEMGGHTVSSLSGELGYRLVDSRDIRIALLLGYRYDIQHFNIVNATQIVPAISVDFTGLNSDYLAQWRSITVGTAFTIPLGPTPFALELSGHAWPNLTYRGTGRWNMRGGSDPNSFSQNPSFLHQADGFGGDVEVRLRYRPSPHWDLSLGWMGTWLQAKNGTDTTYFADGSQAKIGLLDVKNQSNIYSVGIGYLF